MNYNNHDCDKASICDALEKCLCLFCAKKRFLRIVNPAHTSSKDELAAIQILIAEDLSTNTCKTMKSTFVNSFGDNITVQISTNESTI